MSGKLIVFEGTDGSGKATQTALLCRELESRGVPFRKLEFPRYKEESSALLRLYLSGAFGTDPADVNAYAAATFFSVDRYASFKQDWGGWYRQGGLVIADRYTTSNAVHQTSKLPPQERQAFLDWLFDFEYRLMGIPAPDVVVYLSVDPAVSQSLMTGRYQGDESRKDIHEGNLGYLRRSREAAEYCTEKLGWKKIECCRDGVMRPIEDIQEEILELV